MKYYSTNNPAHHVSFAHAVQEGLAPDGGLYMPEFIPKLSSNVLESLHSMTFHEMAFHALHPYTSDDMSDHELREIIKKALVMDAPSIRLHDTQSQHKNIFFLEQFHGPTLAFKDFGGRFMAQFLAFFRQQANKPLTILVATSGDTGSAVAQGFYGLEGINVCILYPSGKVSKVQEQQLTTIGGNVRAIEVQGTFDDCQALVKQAFNDPILRAHGDYTSANSINIARLLPQMLYYFRAIGQVQQEFKNVVFITPSGNFGNLTAGLFTKFMGLPIEHCLAAVNRNDIVPQYLLSGKYEPKPSVQTPSNAMDVGNPSNFARLMALFDNDVQTMRKHVSSYSTSDEDTFVMMKEIHERYGYVADPHGAVGFHALQQYAQSHILSDETAYIILETAHPAKFGDVVEQALGVAPELPERLKACMEKPKQALLLESSYTTLRSYLMQS